MTDHPGARMPTVQTGHTDPTRRDPQVKGKHREEHAHTVAVGILLARHRSEKAGAK